MDFHVLSGAAGLAKSSSRVLVVGVIGHSSALQSKQQVANNIVDRDVFSVKLFVSLSALGLIHAVVVQLPSFDLDATTLPESLKRSGVLSRAAAVEDKAHDAARGHGHSQTGSARLATEVLECFHARTDGGESKESSNSRDGRASKDDVVYLHLSSAVEPSLFAQSVSRMQELHELGPSVCPRSGIAALLSFVVLPCRTFTCGWRTRSPTISRLSFSCSMCAITSL
jgi:hypothetical protein